MNEWMGRGSPAGVLELIEEDAQALSFDELRDAIKTGDPVMAALQADALASVAEGLGRGLRYLAGELAPEGSH